MYLRSKTQGRLRCQKRRSLPQPVKKPQNHFHEYRQKVTVTTLFQTAFHRVFQLLAQTAHVRFHERKSVHTRLSEKNRTQRHTRRNTGSFRWGRYYYPRNVPHVHKHPRAGYQNSKLCRFGGLVKGAPKERKEPTGQRCAYARRCPVGVAAPLGCVILFLLSKLWLVCHALRVFPRVRGEGWYHYPQRALRAAETPDTRLSKRLICRFLRSGGRSSPHNSYFLANTQNFLSAVPVANTFALWYNKSKELEEFQNNYAVKFPFAIASSSPGPRPKQQKGSAIP